MRMVVLIACLTLQSEPAPKEPKVVPLERKDGKYLLGAHEVQLNGLETLITRHALAMLNEDWEALFQLMVFKDSDLAPQVRAKESLRTRKEWAERWTRGPARNFKSPATAILIPPKGDGPIAACCSYSFRLEKGISVWEINFAEKIEGHGWKVVLP